MTRNGVRTGDQSGFSIIELMHTLALLSVGLLGLSSLTLGSIHGNTTAKRITSAAVVAEGKIEEIRQAEYTAIATGSDQIIVTGVPYNRQWTVCADCPVAGAKQVTVEVTWYDQEDKSITLQTIISP